MGNKSGRTRQYIPYLIAAGGLIALLTASSCVPAPGKVVDGGQERPAVSKGEPPCRIESNSSQEQLALYRNYLAEGFFETVIQQCLLVISKGDSVPPADNALYALGEVYANPDYRGKNYPLSRDYFARLIANFPESPLRAEARTFVALYDSFAEKDKKIASLEKGQAAKPPAREAISVRNFEAAVKENLQLIKISGAKSPADHALYNLGLIYAHIDNPAKDFQKARKYFADLIREFPASPLVEESRIWLGLFEVFEKMQQIDLDIEQQKKLLSR